MDVQRLVVDPPRCRMCHERVEPGTGTNVRTADPGDPFTVFLHDACLSGFMRYLTFGHPDASDFVEDEGEGEDN